MSVRAQLVWHLTPNNGAKVFAARCVMRIYQR
nr:MAG TPA: hypothetical protein [Caudoviricetes sp.]